jgi:hypothetical protein
MKKYVFIPFLICVALLASCANIKPVPSIELALIEMNPNSKSAIFELRNYSGKNIEYLDNYFISRPQKSQQAPPVEDLKLIETKKTLKSGESVRLTEKKVFNDFFIGVYVITIPGATKQIIWTESIVNGKM